MSASTDPGACADAGALLPNQPFEALHAHFGMLLGVADFETEQAYHRGKMRLHTAWAHRRGVLWGLAVGTDLPRNEVRVAAGLALDGAGQELHLDADACVNVPAWLATLPEAERNALAGAGSTDAFDAHVLIRHRACLARQVPALLEPCDGTAADTAYSRVIETVELLLRPGLAPEAPPPYHRLRLVFGLDAAALADDGNPLAEDSALLADRDALLALPRAGRMPAAQALLRRCATADAITLAPARSAVGDEWLLTPAAPDDGLVLANLRGLRLGAGSSGLVLAAGTVDYAPRATLVATHAVQDLLAGAFFCCNGTAPLPPAPAPEPPAPAPEPTESPALTPTGTPALTARSATASAMPATRAAPPAFDPASVQLNGRNLRLLARTALAPESVTAEVFSLASFASGEGWKLLRISAVTVDGAAVQLALGATLRRPASGGLLRLVVRCAGPTPPLTAGLQTLADTDFVHTIALNLGS